MAFECAEIVNIPKLNNIRLIAGANGLDRIVRWTYVAECVNEYSELSKWLVGNELVFFTGHLLKHDELELLNIIKILYAKNIAGVIIFIGPYIPEVTSDIIEYANNISLPIFTLPWDIKIIDATEAICHMIISKEHENNTIDNIFDSVLSSNCPISSDLMIYTKNHGVDLESCCTIGIIGTNYQNNETASFMSNDNLNKCYYENRLLKVIQDIFAQCAFRAITALRDNLFVFLFNYSHSSKDTLVKVFDSIKRSTRTIFPGIKIYAGVGKGYQLANLNKSYEEAEKAANVSICEYDCDKMCFFDDLGIYLLFIQINDMRFLEEYYLKVFNSIILHENKDSLRLMTTLQTFFSENCNMEKTSKKLYIHINTLKYRLQKIESLLGCSIEDMNTRVDLCVGLKIMKYLSQLD